MKHRIRAGLIHLTLSAAIATAVFLPIYFYWYPDILFETAGGRHLFLLVAGVDIAIGPLITFLIFVPGKKGLMFDLAVIAFLQSAALAYGVWVLFESRPVFIAFVKDRFELVRVNQIPEEALAKARSMGRGDLPLTGPKVVGVRLPTDPDETFKLMISAFAGADVQAYQQYHVPYDEVRDDVRAKAKTLGELRKLNPARGAEIDRLLVNLGRKEDELRYLPMRAGKSDLAALIDARSADVLKLTSLRPWDY